MGYRLGVDLGTTWTACAVHRPTGVEIVPLGDHGAEVPSVVFLREDGTFVVGEAAERRGLTAPHRLAREFKRRIGDPTPLLLAGSPYSAHALTATLLRWVVERVVEREGASPDAVVVTCPANWGPYKRESLQHGLALADVGDARLVSEPEAAALRYASLERLAVGDVVAVYDLGGGTFDTAVLARTSDGFALRGAPAGIEQLGGVDFDDALFHHVVEALGPDVEDLDTDDEATVTALARLRRDCVQAKEALSSDTEATVPVGLPGLHTAVRVTRSEFEDLVRPPVADTVLALRRALRSAQVEPEQLTAVLLAGGSSRIPLVAETVSAELGRPVAVDAHPKHLVALGAALAGAPAPAPDAGPDVVRPGGTTAQRTGIPHPRTGRPAQVGATQPHARTAPQPPTSGPAPEHQVVPPTAEPTRRTVGSRLRGRPQDGRSVRRTLQVATALLTTALLLVAGLGLDAVGPVPVSSSIPQGTTVRLDGDALADDPVDLGYDDDGETVTVEPAPAATSVALELRLLGWRVGGDRGTELRDGRAVVDVSGSKAVLPGQTIAEISVASLGEATFIATPRDRPLLTLPGGAALVLLLFCAAYGEALAGPVRRGRRLRPLTVVALAALGAGAGLALAVLGWALTEHLLRASVLVTCALLGAAAAVTGVRLLAARAAPVAP